MVLQIYFNHFIGSENGVQSSDYLGVSENVVYPIVPNGFAHRYPVLKNG